MSVAREYPYDVNVNLKTGDVMDEEFFSLKSGIIPALDESDPKRIEYIVSNIYDIEGIVGFKVSARLVLRKGLEVIVGIIRKYTKKPIILDCQKAGTDVPFIERLSIESVYDLIDGIILLPLSGPKSLEAGVEAARKRGVVPIVGGFMTHEGYTEEEGGYIPRRNVERMYLDAAKLGVPWFVVPANRPKIIEELKEPLGEELSKKGLEPKFLGPGIGRQGGDVRRAIKASEPYPFYGIVGRDIREARDPRKVVMEFCKVLYGD